MLSDACPHDRMPNRSTPLSTGAPQSTTLVAAREAGRSPPAARANTLTLTLPTLARWARPSRSSPLGRCGRRARWSRRCGAFAQTMAGDGEKSCRPPPPPLFRTRAVQSFPVGRIWPALLEAQKNTPQKKGGNEKEVVCHHLRTYHDTNSGLNLPG